VKKDPANTLEGTFPPPLIVLALTLIGFGLQWYQPLRYQNTSHRGYWLFAGIILMLFAGSVALLARRVMLTRKTPISFGKPTVAIIAEGPFRFTRNPLYLSLLFLYTGIGIEADSLWFALLLIVVFSFLHLVVVREEQYLEQSFGNEYLLYKSAVRRWL
jgi:protein-S-isoprenylcysteine O-methyltransferase Ste14